MCPIRNLDQLIYGTKILMHSMVRDFKLQSLSFMLSEKQRKSNGVLPQLMSQLMKNFCRGNCAMMDKNRFILHLHHNSVIFDYDIIWSYYSVPKLQHLAFWQLIEMLKKSRTKKCWEAHLTFHKFCPTCAALEMISRSLQCCSDHL